MERGLLLFVNGQSDSLTICFPFLAMLLPLNVARFATISLLRESIRYPSLNGARIAIIDDNVNSHSSHRLSFGAYP
jgi:hypothetical protein